MSKNEEALKWAARKKLVNDSLIVHGEKEDVSEFRRGLDRIAEEFKNRPACNVPDCNEAIPEDMDDQPTCETCSQRVCLAHVVNRDGYSLCPTCYRQERDAAMSIADEMRHFHTMISFSFPPSGRMLGVPMMNACDIEAKLEAWLKTIREVL